MTTAGGGNTGGAPKKKQRIGSSSRLSSTFATINSSFSDGTLAEGSHKPPILPVASSSGGFNDADTADVILRLQIESQSPPLEPSVASSNSTTPTTAIDLTEIQIYLHSRVLLRSKYFAALLSERWQQQQVDESSSSQNSQQVYHFRLSVPANNDSINHYLSVLQLLYSDDLPSSIDSVSTTLNLLPVALVLLFEDCIKACVKFLEAVPWSEDEEKRIMNLIPILSHEESEELLTRVSPVKDNSSERMLYGLIRSAIYNHSNMAFAKAFVAKILRDFSSKESARVVLNTAFEKSFNFVKQSLEEYSSPDLRGDHNETEAIQRLNLHTALTNGKHLVWLVERMIELKVADTAVKVWSDQASFTADLMRAIQDDAWKNFVPSLPGVVLRCTSRLANAVATGNIVVDKQVRTKLVKDWLPVLNLCKESAPLMGPTHKSLYLELEETFLKIISTLPMSDAQNLLQQCLTFSTRYIDDCPHLVAAFNTWFRRVNENEK